jgi:hypothetical protein
MNHDAYLQSLELYAEASGIIVERKREDDDGAWVPSRRAIRIDPELADSTEIATFLHELGHSEDDSFFDTREWKKIDRSYSAFQKRRYTYDQWQLVIRCEERAWRFGRAIAKRLRIPLGKWFDEEEADALRAYRSP